jgi:transposase
MATSGRGSGVVGYNVQVAVDTKHHLIVAHEVTNEGSDRAQLANIACQAKEALGVDELQAVADRGYFNSDQILACDKAGITVTLPKPMTSNAKAEGRFGKQDFRYLAEEDVYVCPAGEKLSYHYTNEENGLVLRRYWTNACQSCAIKQRCTIGKERRITRWEHEHVLEAVQKRLDKNPQAMRQRRETAEHPFGTLKMRMGATHFLMKRLPKVATEMALHVLAYNLTRVMNIMGIQPLMAAIRAQDPKRTSTDSFCCDAVHSVVDRVRRWFSARKINPIRRPEQSGTSTMEMSSQLPNLPTLTGKTAAVRGILSWWTRRFSPSPRKSLAGGKWLVGWF